MFSILLRLAVSLFHLMDDLLEGVELFNTGHYFEAHERWEDLWRHEGGEARLFYQGLIQAAVALHHLSRGNRRGGRAILERAVAKLRPFGQRYMGIDTADLVDQLDSILSGEDASSRIRILQD